MFTKSTSNEIIDNVLIELESYIHCHIFTASPFLWPSNSHKIHTYCVYPCCSPIKRETTFKSPQRYKLYILDSMTSQAALSYHMTLSCGQHALLKRRFPLC